MLSFPLSGNGPSARSLGLHPGYISSRVYATIPIAPATTVAVPAVDTVYLYPFQVLAPITIASMRLRITTGGAGSSAKGAIWANSFTSMRPLGAPVVVDNTGVATTSSGVDVTLAATGTLNPGIYWAGSKFTGTLPQTNSIAANNTWLAFIAGGATGGSTLQNAYSFADAYANNMPTFVEGATFTALSGASGAPLIYLVT